MRIGSGPVQTLRRTPLYERHAALGALLVPFAGWEMPVQYAGISEEHMAVRSRAGVFDVSCGSGARRRPPRAYLRRLSTTSIGSGRAGLCALLTNERSGIVGDLIAYRQGRRLSLVVNAANVT
jgi:aminomethyltransferase